MSGTPSKRARARAWTQIPLWQETAAPAGDLVPTRPLLRNASCERILTSVRQVRTFFPELDGVSIKVGLTRSAAGFASYGEPWIWINPYRLRRHTIAHELVHLLQVRGLLPGGEKSADLHALARHPVLVDDVPYYLRVPAPLRRMAEDRPAQVYGLLWRTASESSCRREAGLRTYLRWFETELSARWRALDRELHLESGGPAARSRNAGVVFTGRAVGAGRAARGGEPGPQPSLF